MSEQSQLKLSVVRHHERVALVRAKGLADAVLVFLERGLVLKVGRPRGEAPGLGVQVERAVHARALVRVLLQWQDEV